MDVQVGPARPADALAAARVLAAALRDDDVVRALVPGDHDRLARLTTVYGYVVRTGPAHGGLVDVARDGTDGPVVGVAVWERPGGGRHAGPTGGWGSRTWARARDLPRLVGAIGPAHLPAAARALHTLTAHRPRYPHWYLADLAVDPAAHGRGIGSALLSQRLRAVDADGLPAYLEATTEDSRRLYQRFGFRPVDTVALRGATATAMLRLADGRG